MAPDVASHFSIHVDIPLRQECRYMISENATTAVPLLDANAVAQEFNSVGKVLLIGLAQIDGPSFSANEDDRTVARNRSARR